MGSVVSQAIRSGGTCPYDGWREVVRLATSGVQLATASSKAQKHKRAVSMPIWFILCRFCAVKNEAAVGRWVALASYFLPLTWG